jgi:hypothetical protein
MRGDYYIQCKPIISHNTQAYAIMKQIHEVVNTMLRSFDLKKNNENLEEHEDNQLD